MFDVIVRGGQIVDGTGAPAYTGDVAVRDGVIVEVGGRIDGAARQVIDADGAVVAPGWVDLHTHYDGQVSWDDTLDPSFSNGVTTVVMGNCGVGFAPVRPGNERQLIELMEGVEDIPGTALYEGMEWGRWESFPEYLDYLATRRYTLDVAAMVPHGALRAYVMGERAVGDSDATAEDLDAMHRLVSEALTAGAVGFSTSRTVGHRSLWGDPVPGTFAAAEELLAIAAAMRSTGRGVFEMIPAGTVGQLASLGGEVTTQEAEHDLMVRFAQASGRPVTFTLVQSPDFDPDLWRHILRRTEAANAAGAQLRPQVSSRPIGFVTGLSAYHAFMRRPTYLALAHLPLAERVAALARPEVRAAILAEDDVRPEAPGSMENVYGLFRRAAAVLYPLDDPLDLEPTMAATLGAQAAARGVEVMEHLYDFLLDAGGTRFASLSAVDIHARMNVLHEMLTHPDTVTGLSDAGAHVTLICDATMPTTQVTFWTRDRTRGEQLPLEFVVHQQTRRNAELYGFGDRGALIPGLRADLNVFDHDRLAVAPPVAHHDLPAGGTRLMQPVSGYVATLCAGAVTRLHDTDTGARPGRLARGVAFG
jgi:N-acyl-D-aspartate/D-glutamate deacylase